MEEDNIEAITNKETDINELPNQIKTKLNSFDESLTELEDILKPFLKIPIIDLKEKIGDPLQNAKLDLMVAYTTNSLFWNYLVTQGVDPKAHPIKDELLRIKQYIGRVQALQDKKKMARVDTNAAKRFVRSALWQAEDKDNQQVDEDVVEERKEKQKKEKKRKKNNDDDSEKKIKKKKKKKTKQD